MCRPWLIAFPIAFLLCSTLHAEANYGQDVAPVLQKRCSGCHGTAQQMSGLRLDTPEAVLAGGYSGAVVVAGKSGESKLIQRVTSSKPGHQMPPAGPRLTAAEVDSLKTWIDEGAKAPPGLAAAKPAEKPAPWSFQALRRPVAPDVRQRAWVRNPIDAFVLARLETESLPPSPEAPKATLLRRLSLDLTGLPPTPAELEAFLADNRPDAYEQQVDRMLASPHFGEKWARLWLDLAHYADSDGYEKDQVRPYAWRYRNWVINAFNHDMPFDQFTVEQLAGDLLPHATVEQRVATGFLRNTLTNREAGVDRQEARFEQLVNRTNTMSTVWLGLTTGCAQCHNHKFDPISQKDYYQLMAFMDRAEELDIDAPLAGEMGPYLQARPGFEKKQEEILIKHQVREAQAEWEKNLRAAITKPGENLEWDFMITSMKAMFDQAVRVLQTDPAQRTVAQREKLVRYFLANIGPDFGRDAELKKKLATARDQLKELDASFTPLTQAMAMTETTVPVQSHLRVGGDWKSLGIEVQPAGLSALPPLAAGVKPNRLALAQWLVAKENPLTARVTVNRLWQELFGRGLVRTSEDFGTQGEKPSHPALLDWLAADFQENGWSQKRALKQMVLSATYRQASNVRPDLKDRDPENVLLARQSRIRLPAELVRDVALMASGLLNPEIGGRSVRPPQPAGVAELGYGNSVKWVESKGMDRYRRGLYVHFQRTTPYPQLMTFDAPEGTVTCSRRRRSNGPLQALNLLNDPVFFEAAQGLAERVLQESAAAWPARVEYAFQLCLSRPPSSREKERLLQYVTGQTEMLRKDLQAAETVFPAAGQHAEAVDAAALVSLSRVLLNLDETLTRE